MKAYYVRHGQSEANVRYEVADGGAVLLSAKGEAQARAAGQQLRAAGVTKVFSSPYERAYRTAVIITEAIGITPDKIVRLDGLRERGLGDLEGHVSTHPHEYYLFADNEHGLEPTEQLLERSLEALEQIRHACRHDDVVLVVGHTVAGYYFIEVSKGHRRVNQFEPWFDLPNATPIDITIADT